MDLPGRLPEIPFNMNVKFVAPKIQDLRVQLHFELNNIIDQYGVQPIEKLVQTVGVILDQWNDETILRSEIEEECQELKEKLFNIEFKYQNETLQNKSLREELYEIEDGNCIIKLTSMKDITSHGESKSEALLILERKTEEQNLEIKKLTSLIEQLKSELKQTKLKCSQFKTYISQTHEDFHNLTKACDQYKSDLLNSKQWMSDHAITMYFNVLGKEANAKDVQVKFVEPCVTQLIQLANNESVKIHLESMELNDYRAILFPLNNSMEAHDGSGSHWSLLVLDFKYSQWLHYDSVNSLNTHNAFRFSKKVDSLLELKCEFIDVESSQQENLFDCRIYTLINAQNLLSVGSKWSVRKYHFNVDGLIQAFRLGSNHQH